MIRPFTAICVLLAGTSGLYLYSEKHRTTVLDQQISRIVQDTQRTRERTAMLRAEWALLNQPDRLQSLAARFLPALHPMAPTQFVQMASLAQRLPEIAKPAPTASAPVVAVAEAPQIAPVQVMARAVVTSDAPTTSDAPAATDAPAISDVSAATDASAAEPRLAETNPREPKRHAPARSVAAPFGSAQVANAVPASRPRAPFRTAATFRATPLSLAPARPPLQHGGPAGRLPTYEGSVRALVSTGSTYSHPAPMQAAWHPAWHPAWRPAYAQVSAPGPAAGVRSSLGFSHVALPPPVPVRDGD